MLLCFALWRTRKPTGQWDGIPTVWRGKVRIVWTYGPLPLIEEPSWRCRLERLDSFLWWKREEMLRADHRVGIWWCTLIIMGRSETPWYAPAFPEWTPLRLQQQKPQPSESPVVTEMWAILKTQGRGDVADLTASFIYCTFYKQASASRICTMYSRHLVLSVSLSFLGNLFLTQILGFWWYLSSVTLDHNWQVFYRWAPMQPKPQFPPHLIGQSDLTTQLNSSNRP